ncbi:MAG: 50S ribosomal protein L21, partial [Myxococcota bacterium]
LMVGGEGAPRVGTPTVDGVKVRTTIAEQGRGPKLRLFKLKRRKGYRRRQGHRQAYTALRVESIEG